MKKLLFLLVIINTCFVFSQDPIAESPKIVIKVPLGETIQLAYGSVKFVEVRGHSYRAVTLPCAVSREQGPDKRLENHL